MQGYVYTLVDPRLPDEVRYVGITSKNIYFRFLEHMKEAKYFPNKYSHKLHWIRKVVDEGQEPLIQIVEEIEFDNEEDLFLREVYWIAHYKNLGAKLTNSNSGGRGQLGLKHSQKTKELLSEKAKEQWDKMTEEQLILYKEKKAKQMKGNSFRKGKKDPPERVESKKGILRGKNSPTWKGFLLRMDDKFQVLDRWESIGEAAKQFETGYKNIWSATWKKTKEGKPMKAAGFYWKYELKD